MPILTEAEIFHNKRPQQSRTATLTNIQVEQNSQHTGTTKTESQLCMIYQNWQITTGIINKRVYALITVSTNGSKRYLLFPQFTIRV